ncbi:MAG: hypothetical protein FWF18_00380 [Dehalococcoidia bacterium]|nr:hypothetical protein [Dehalococcoidia bacterium]
MRIKQYLGANDNDRLRKFGQPVAGELELAVVSPSEDIFEGDKWKLGGCPRCRGDIFLEPEDGQMLGHCLQCGYVGVRVVAQLPKVLSLDD